MRIFLNSVRNLPRNTKEYFMQCESTANDTCAPDTITVKVDKFSIVFIFPCFVALLRPRRYTSNDDTALKQLVWKKLKKKFNFELYWKEQKRKNDVNVCLNGSETICYSRIIKKFIFVRTAYKNWTHKNNIH